MMNYEAFEKDGYNYKGLKGYSFDVAKAITEIKAGKVNYRVDKVGNIHVTVGKVSFEAKQLVENIRVIYDTLVKLRPSTVKGVFVKHVAIASTMGPGITVDPDFITKAV